MNHLGRWSTLIVLGALSIAPNLEARTCTGNGDVIGSFGWTGSRSPQFVPAPDPLALPAPPKAGSSTPIGALAAGAVNSAAFAGVGRVYLDGNGGIHSSANSTSPLLPVGKYSVNTDCTISATITDAFATPGEAGLTPTQASATFEGVIVQGGSELNLVQTGGAGGTVLTLNKTRQFTGCSNDGLAGTFGLSGSGLTTVAATETAPAVSTPFNLAARFVADGTGKFVQDPLALLSPLAARQMTGTYSINSDCTGTGTLVGSDGKSRKVNLVVVSSSVGTAVSQSIVFAFTDAGVVGAGLAQQQ